MLSHYEKVVKYESSGYNISKNRSSIIDLIYILNVYVHKYVQHVFTGDVFIKSHLHDQPVPHIRRCFNIKHTYVYYCVGPFYENQVRSNHQYWLAYLTDSKKGMHLVRLFIQRIYI